MPQENKPYAFSRGEGNSIWYLQTLMTIKATGEETRGSFGFMEVVAPPGSGAKPHIHHDDDESFYVIEGSATYFCGDHTFKAEAGTFVFLPRGIVHSFLVEGTMPMRVLQSNTPAGLEHYHREMGEPAKSLTLPPSPAGPPDVEKMKALAKKYHVELVIPSPDQSES